MKKNALVSICVLVLLLVTISGCSKKTSVEPAKSSPSPEVTASTSEASATSKPDADTSSEGALSVITLGTTENGKYTNSFFGLSAAVPEGWSDISEEEKLKESEISDISKLAETENEIYGFVFQNSEELADVTCTFTAVDESLVATADDYGEYLKGIYADLYSDSSDITKTELGGNEFLTFTLKDKSDDGVLISDVYCTIKNGYAIEIKSSYYEDETADVDAVKSVIDSITFTE